ncbi:PREDICTED: proline-rich protein 5-like [Amphimedon queenslandica]|uniref:Uncharacterized protein n=1 Tax=Amphimedon queenslandica TaxID=400682 RepID=A0A1X7V9M1_AMPQE|nr:PREDICTED: proline-rich protein 5-like [Amphimedon queenslandica]|eukprot:XP_003385148.1 PREDICTED: proline-rich protein 5-like [Amphimedon queenslandica]
MTQRDQSVPFGYALINLSEQEARQVQWQAELKGEDWSAVQNVLTRLFQLRKLPELATELLPINERLLKLSKSGVGAFLSEFYQEQLLKKCMIILREDVREESGQMLLEKLGHVWVQFYTSILPTLQAFFAPIQFKGLSIRALTLISFRDIVLLKTSIEDALDSSVSSSIPVSPEIKQMLLVLQSVHKSPPTEQFYELQILVSKVVQPYLCMEYGPCQVADSFAMKRHHSLGGLHDMKVKTPDTPNTPSSIKSLFV